VSGNLRDFITLSSYSGDTTEITYCSYNDSTLARKESYNYKTGRRKWSMSCDRCGNPQHTGNPDSTGTAYKDEDYYYYRYHKGGSLMYKADVIMHENFSNVKEEVFDSSGRLIEAIDENSVYYRGDSIISGPDTVRFRYLDDNGFVQKIYRGDKLLIAFSYNSHNQFDSVRFAYGYGYEDHPYENGSWGKYYVKYYYDKQNRYIGQCKFCEDQWCKKQMGEELHDCMTVSYNKKGLLENKLTYSAPAFTTNAKLIKRHPFWHHAVYEYWK
jgi:hypothetical protein